MKKRFKKYSILLEQNADFCFISCGMYFSVVSVLQSMIKNRSVPKPHRTEMCKFEKERKKEGKEGRYHYLSSFVSLV